MYRSHFDWDFPDRRWHNNMNGISMNWRVIVVSIFGLFLAFQHINAFPHEIRTSAEEKETAARVVEFKPSSRENSLAQNTTTPGVQTTKATEVESKESSEKDSAEEFFYLPNAYNTPTYRLQLRYFILIQGYVNKLLTEGRDFLEVSLKAMNALADKTAGIEANITRMDTILKRIKNQDLSKNYVADITEKTDIIDELAELYGDLEIMVRDQVPEDDAPVLTEIFDNIDLPGYNGRLDAFLKETANEITRVANKFFNKLNEQEKQKYAELVKWYEDFKQPKADLDKYNDAVDLLNYLLIHRF